MTVTSTTMPPPVVPVAILAVIEAEDAAWNAGDAEAFFEAATPDVVFTNIVGMFSVGHAPMVAQHAHIFSTIYQGSTLKQTIANLVMVRPDVAMVDTLAEVSGFKHLPPGAEAIDGVLRTRLEPVMVMDGERWRVAAFHNVTVNPVANAGGLRRSPTASLGGVETPSWLALARLHACWHYRQREG
jgi:uncharacterized protein (TIGR02246 family)